MQQGLFSSFIGLVISISVLVYLFKIRSDTNENLFKQPIEPSLKEKFFYSTNATPAVNPADVSIKCELYQEAIMNPKVTKLEDFFYLNIENIHSKANILLLIALLTVIMLVLAFLGIFLFVMTNSVFFICLTCIIAFGNIALSISNLVLTILFLLSYYNGDTNRFVEFLSCKNVNKNEFSNYLFAEKLKKDFTIFVVLNIINLFMNSKTNTKNDSNNQQGQQQAEGQNEEVVRTI